MEEKLAQLEPKKVVIAGLVAGLLWLVLPFDNISTLNTQQANIRNQIREVDKELEDVRAAIVNNEAFEREVRETAQAYREILEYFPVDFSVPDFMLMLTSQMTEAGGSKINVEPMPKVTVSDIYDRHPFSVEMEGDYATFMKFLSGLTKLPQITSVKSLKLTTISADSRKSVLRLQGVISGYSYNGNLGAEGSLNSEEGS